ncbi:forkhead box protein J1 [Apus apus]|uniref:forkhead box protein J1 n=1 Tax=Apus apus TaxID=8895 RepID=UPI0021F8762B|nr:forkhead box protein J1 [Apus apus]
MAEGWPDNSGKGRKSHSAGLDNSLTSLTWLTNFSVKDTNMARPPWIPDPLERHRTPSFAAPCSPLAADPACMGVPHTPCNPISSSTPRVVQHTVPTCPQLPEDVDYKTNPHVKPPYSYATLICMAMEASGKPKITLSAIYKWITDNFCYFRHADPTWQNSIRHNLSLNKCFIKVPREKDEPGKGGFWKIDPLYADQLKKGAFKKRRLSPAQIHPAFTRRAQQEPRCDASPAAPVCTPTNIFNVNTESQQLLKEFEEITGSQTWNPADGKAGQKRQQFSPHRPAKVARLSNSALLSQEVQKELGSLKGDLDWEAIFDTNLDADLSTFGDLDLLPPISPITHDLELTVHGQHSEGLQEQVLTEANQNTLGFDETFMATAFLQNPWDEGTNDGLTNTVNMEQVFEFNDAPLPEDMKDWSSLASLL